MSPDLYWIVGPWRGRSGLIAAGILATAGVNLDDAIQTVSFARGLDVPETLDQRLWVQGLRLKPPAAAG